LRKFGGFRRKSGGGTGGGFGRKCRKNEGFKAGEGGRFAGEIGVGKTDERIWGGGLGGEIEGLLHCDLGQITTWLGRGERRVEGGWFVWVC